MYQFVSSVIDVRGSRGSRYNAFGQEFAACLLLLVFSVEDFSQDCQPVNLH